PGHADDVAAVAPLIAGSVVDVCIERLHRGDAGKVTHSPTGAEVMWQKLVRVATDFVAAFRRNTAAGAGRRRSLSVQDVGLDFSVRTGAEVVPVLSANTLPGFRKPVVHERRVLTAVDSPEERVRKCLTADCRHTVGRDEKSSRAVFSLGRIVEERRIQQ